LTHLQRFWAVRAEGGKFEEVFIGPDGDDGVGGWNPSPIKLPEEIFRRA
jgi:hypothetical protein